MRRQCRAILALSRLGESGDMFPLGRLESLLCIAGVESQVFSFEVQDNTWLLDQLRLRLLLRYNIRFEMTGADET